MEWLYVLTLCMALGAAENLEEDVSMDGSSLYEGDMILTPEQRMAADLGLDVDDPLGRGAMANKDRKWPQGVLIYAIDPKLASDRRAKGAIYAGMREWTRKTKNCIRFKQRTNEPAYAYFKIGSGCSSYVGRTGRRQDINLARGCWTTGIVAHEIGHALGFWHEQSRPDRDRYVTVYWDNIIDRARHNFNKYSHSIIDSLKTPYDYNSLMHYGSRDFSKNGRPTIVPKQSGKSIGQRWYVSYWDAIQMRRLYGCGWRVGDDGRKYLHKVLIR